MQNICKIFAKYLKNMQKKMQNMQKICKQYEKIYAKICKNMQNMQKICTRCKKYAQYAKNIQKKCSRPNQYAASPICRICKKYAKNVQNMQFMQIMPPACKIVICTGTCGSGCRRRRPLAGPGADSEAVPRRRRPGCQCATVRL